MAADGPARADTLGEAGGVTPTLVRCGARRASVVRLTAASWRPGDTLRATLFLSGDPPAYLDVDVSSAGPSARVFRQSVRIE